MATPTKSDPNEESTDRDRTTEQPGPALLNERPLLGIFVHLAALFAGFFGLGFAVAGVVYSLSDHEFTRENARQALNWHLFTLAFSVTFFGFAFVFVFTADAIPLPDVVLLVPFLVIFVGLFVSMALLVLTIVFALIATVRAIFGEAWVYPLAPDVVD